ncbi:MAG TPA: alpha-amylase family glycosyl hydrolase [Thermoanaerobaculia bacterium]|nr:alpha-amylase family glycosyl hydrolase [Thermoanaerobaculia bacterium]
MPVAELDRLAAAGVDLLWLMGVWPSGPRGIEIARTLPDLLADYRRLLPDFGDGDVGGSPYSIAAYAVDPALGGAGALARLRERLAARGMRLLLDFVVNHTGLDHPWVRERPDLYVQGSAEDLARAPGDFFAVDTGQGRRILAHGRDPYFPGWTDTAQLNLLHPETRARLRAQATELAGLCDGVRCDMGMLALEEVWHRTWGERATAPLPQPAVGELWTELIGAARARRPDFLFVAEAYWGLEARLQELGFDSTYDKTLYERLRHGAGREVREHLRAPLGYQRRSVRFLENHDEPRAAAAFPWDRHRAAAVVAATVPGLLLLHDGQLEGRRTRQPIQLLRRPAEAPETETARFYERLLAAARRRPGADWRLLEPRPAWEGNPTAEDFVASLWTEDGRLRLAAVNFSADQGQCYLDLAGSGIGGGEVELRDALSDTRYRRPGGGLETQGLYLDMPPFGAHLFDLTGG